MKLVWTIAALEDREAIFDYMATQNPKAAVALDEKIALQVDTLQNFSLVGRVVGTRELVIPHTSFLAAYRIAGDIVLILRLLHGSRHWPDSDAF